MPLLQAGETQASGSPKRLICAADFPFENKTFSKMAGNFHQLYHVVSICIVVFFYWRRGTHGEKEWIFYGGGSVNCCLVSRGFDITINHFYQLVDFASHGA